MTYALDCRYDSRKSFYGKALVEGNYDETKLYSYGTLVAKITKANNTTTYYYLGSYSQTTTRHQKEFFKQNGLDDNQIKKLFKEGELALNE